MHRSLGPFLALLLLLVVALVACGGGGGGDAADTASEPAGPVTDTVQVTGTDDLNWSSTQRRAKAGEVNVELTCEDAINHDFAIEELDDVSVVACAPGGSDTGTIELEPGTYTFYCTVPGHRKAGMEGVLVVEE